MKNQSVHSKLYRNRKMLIKEVFDLVEQGRRIANQSYNFYLQKKTELNQLGYDLIISDENDYNGLPILKVIKIPDYDFGPACKNACFATKRN